MEYEVNDDESSITNTKNINIDHFTKVFETDSNSHFKKVYYTPEASQYIFRDVYLNYLGFPRIVGLFG
jgi:hypothetical protein